jgi:microcystin-dependent protein
MDAYLGEIRLVAGVTNLLPANWAYCNGQLVRISDNQALYSLIGTKFGGDGINTFALPDLRGKLPIGQGAGTNLTPRYLAQSGGGEQATLVEAQIPLHSHPFNATGNPAASSSPSGALFANSAPNGFYADMPVPPVAVQTLLGDTIAGSGGSNQPHENRMPTMAMNYIIALQGNYPTRP